MFISIIKTRLRKLTGVLTVHCTLRNDYRNLGMVKYASCRCGGLREEAHCRLLQDCDAVSLKR